MIVETVASAKVNLTLHVTGQREDGYHLLDSLVAFADIGDRIEAESLENGFSVEGPFADDVPHDEENLALKALELFGQLRPTRLKLWKNLPVASGLGGGAADAAAALRAAGQLWKLALPSDMEMAALGADIPVCAAGRACRMQGIGEQLLDVPPLPPLDIVLANPGIPVETAKVYSRLETKENAPMERELPRWTTEDDFTLWLADQRNDLLVPAMEIAPEIGAVLEALRGTGALRTGMSGSGATCWALFRKDGLSAKSAAEFLRSTQPDWWIESGRLLNKAA